MNTSKTDKVKNYILEEVKSGRIRNGQRLPGCRETALRLAVNKITVNKAYNELEAEHKVYCIPRGGFYLVGMEESSKNVQEYVDFTMVRPDDRLIPYREFTHVINKAVEEYKNSLFGYEPAAGLPALRDTLRQKFEKDGVYTSPENIIVTHGAQQAIGLALQMLFHNKKGKLLVEAPTYILALELAKCLGIDVIGIERRVDGYDFKRMEALFKTGEIKAFYVIPRHHNPTGYSLSEKDKQKIVELSHKYDVCIIEDDYLADLGSKKGSMPIHYYDISKETIYIRSFSKTFMPGIRMGAAVFPGSMTKEAANLKHLSDLNTSKLPQAALDIFIKSGMYDNHIRKVKKSYETKLKKAAEIFRALSPKELVWYVPEHGIFLWIKLPEKIDALKLQKKLEDQRILISPAGEFFPKCWSSGESHKNMNYVRLCISGVPEENINALASVLSLIRSYEGEY